MLPLQVTLLVAISLFFAILFLQSGIDKVVDWKGNFEFHTLHFAKSPLKKFALPMLVTMTLMEISCGLLSLTGLFYFLLKGDSSISYYACCLAAFIFISLFFGQRISKDYKGAATLVPYFIVSLIGLYVTFS